MSYVSSRRERTCLHVGVKCVDPWLRVFEDALRCSSEVGDSGCAFKSGRESFDSWIRGMEAVNTKLCFEGMMDSKIATLEGRISAIL